jgi:hypothetical protein
MAASTDARLTDRHADNLPSYFEAIHWRKFDARSTLDHLAAVVQTECSLPATHCPTRVNIQD